MIRESTRRRRRSRSISPGRGASKRARSRSKDRRGRNTGAARDANRIVAVPRRDKRLRDERRMPRSEREMDTRHAPNSLYASGGGGSGMGGGRERDVHVRELPVKSSSYRGGGGGVGGGGMLGGRGVVVHHQPPMYAAGMDMRGGVSDHRGGGTYAGVGGGSGGMNGHARGGGYAVTLPRGRNDDRGDRERERERELQRERDRREREREREREKERKLLREREERARQREARAAADLRAAEVLRRDTARLRDEAAAHARASSGTGGARGTSGNGNGTRVGLGEGGIGGGGPTNELTESGDRMPPRGRARDRGRERMTVRSQKGTYMKKDQVDALFLKVIKKMAEDKSRFPCSASLINDRMKQASVEDYNVANSEYMRFANVLARFEKDKIVGTTKSKDRLQILWTKFSPLDTSAEQDTRGAAPTDTRRNASGESRNTRVIVRGGPLKLYFCAADEIKFAGTGGEGTVTTAASPYADIIALLQARGEVMTSHDQKKRVGEAVAVPPQTAETKTEVATAEDKPARLAAEASGESTATEYGTQSHVVGEGVSSSTGKGDNVTVKGKGGAELDRGEVGESAEEQEQEEGGIPMKEGAVAGRGGGVKGEGDEGVVAVNSGAESSIKDPEKDGKEDRLTAREIFDREVAWLRSSHALVAEISTPSTSVGFKIALMTHQRFKPCLGLICKSTDNNGKDSQSTASALSPMLRGSANLEIHEYTEPSDIDEILDEWIDRRILRKRDRDDSRRGGRRGRGDSREPPIKKEKELDGSVRGQAGRDGEDGVEENAREKLDAGGGGSNGAGVRRGAANDRDHEEDENMDDQSLVGGRDSGTGVGGEGAESLVSDDEDEDDHEEVEDATGAHDAATAVAVGVSEGAGASLGLGQTGGGVDEMEVTDYGSAPEHGEVDVEVGAGAEDHVDHGEVSGGGGGDDSEKSTDEAIV